MKVYISGENSIIIYFAKKPSPSLISQIAHYHEQIKDQLGNAYIDGVASYISLSIFYDISQLSVAKVQEKIKKIVNKKINTHHQYQGKVHQIAVFYDEAVGLDLAQILLAKGVKKSDFIQIHTQKTYTVYSIGFMPNFAYLGTLDNILCTPRHKKPRSRINAGSLGIANCQTGIYPSASAAGWQIIGRTPLDLSVNTGIKFQVGDKVQFISIDYQHYLDLGGATSI